MLTPPGSRTVTAKRCFHPPACFAGWAVTDAAASRSTVRGDSIFTHMGFLLVDGQYLWNLLFTGRPDADCAGPVGAGKQLAAVREGHCRKCCRMPPERGLLLSRRNV